MTKLRIYVFLLVLSIVMGSVFFYQHFTIRNTEASLWDVLNMLVSTIMLFLCGRDLIKSQLIKLGYASLILCGSAGAGALMCFVIWL